MTSTWRPPPSWDMTQPVGPLQSGNPPHPWNTPNSQDPVQSGYPPPPSNPLQPSNPSENSDAITTAPPTTLSEASTQQDSSTQTEDNRLDQRAPQAQNRRRFQIKRQVQRRAQREVQRLRWMSNILPRRISPPRVFLRRDPLGQPQQTDLPNVSARPLTSTGLLPPPESNPPSREYIWGWIDRRDQGLSYGDLPTWLRDASQELSLKGAFDAMTELAGKIPGDTSAHFELLAKPVVDDFHHQNAPTPQESDSSMMVSQFAATQTRPYYAALFATKQGRHYGTSWHWWAIASVREAGPLDTTASDPGKPQHLFVYDSRPLQLDLEGLRTTRGLRDFLRNDQYRMLKRLNQAVPIKYLFLNQARLRMPDLSNRLQETLWWIFNVVSRGDMPIEIGSELSDLRWKAVDAITLEFEHDEQDTGANAERKLILRSIARAVER